MGLASILDYFFSFNILLDLIWFLQIPLETHAKIP